MIYFSSFVIVLSCVMILNYTNKLKNTYLLARIKKEYKKNLNLWIALGSTYSIFLVLKVIENNI